VVNVYKIVCSFGAILKKRKDKSYSKVKNDSPMKNFLVKTKDSKFIVVNQNSIVTNDTMTYNSKFSYEKPI
jgi:hypothetical protein